MSAPTPRRRRPVAVVIAASVVILAVLLAGYWATHRSVVPSILAAKSTRERHIAVMPFESVGRDPASEALADGMTNELTAVLGKVPGLRLAGRPAVYAYHDSAVNPRKVGANLGVEALLLGTVTRSGNGLKVTAQLWGSDSVALWSGSFERAAQGVFAVEDSIARAVVGQFKLTLGTGVHAAVVAGTQSPQAHDLYLRGAFYWRKYTAPDLRKALALFDSAKALDSNYAASWTGVAQVWVNLADDWVAPHDAYPKALAAAHKALALDSTNVEAWLALARTEERYEYDIIAAERHVRSAILLDSSNADALGALANILWRNGARDSAFAEARRAAELDPTSARVASSVGYYFGELGLLDSAEVWYLKAHDLDTTYTTSHGGRAYLRMRQRYWAYAIQELSKADAQPLRTASFVALCEARLGKTADARRDVATLEAQRETGRYVAADFIAAVYVGLNERDTAFRWLDQAFVDRSGGLWDMTGFQWDPIRDDPRFRALQQRIANSPLTQ